MKKIIFVFSTILLSLSLSTTAYSTSLEKNLIKGVKFLDDVSEVEWYKVEGKSVIIGWKGLPKFFPHTNRKAAIRGSISTGREVHVWSVRSTAKNWSVGSGKSYICFVSAINGRVKNGNCKR